MSKTKQCHRVIIGSDHGGYELKEHLKRHLSDEGYDVVDFGCYCTDSVDYPDIAFLVAQAVAGQAQAFGIMIDGIGQASAVVANKVPGVIATPCWDAFSANSAREHDDANLITLGGQTLGKALACSIVDLFLTTPFGGGRHARRVNKIRDIEARFMRR